MSCTTLFSSQTTFITYFTNEIKSNQRKELRLILPVVLWRHINHIGSDLWANFIVPPPPEMCQHIYKLSMQNQSVLIVVHHPFSFAVFLKVWLTDSGSPLHILTIGCHCFKQKQTPAPHNKQETYSTEGIKK